VYDTLNPKLTVAPGATLPFQVLVTVTRWPLVVWAPSHSEARRWPVGSVNSARQVASVVEPPLTIVYLPSYPAPQSEDLLNVALTPFAANAVGVLGATRIPVIMSGATAKMAGRCHRVRDIVVVSLLGQGVSVEFPSARRGVHLYGGIWV
jgi:hypothetical protein